MTAEVLSLFILSMVLALVAVGLAAWRIVRDVRRKSKWKS